MRAKTVILVMMLLVMLAGSAAVTEASLSVHYQFVGKGNWSLDGVGSVNTPVGDIQAVVPPGSTVVKAFLYSTLNDEGVVPTVVFDGVTIGPSQWTALGANDYLQAFRADVTAQVAAKIGSGSTNQFTFTVNSESDTAVIDGEVLAIVYSNPAEQERTIAFMDGFSASTGDSTVFNFDEPLVMGTNFEALLSLGIGYSSQAGGNNQASQVDINGRRLTSSAGGEDDGETVNGGLITIGGLGDDPANPPDPYALPDIVLGARTDDELYNLALGNATNATPFLSNGLTSFTVNTLNPSEDDNIFFLGLNVTARGGVASTNDCSLEAVIAQIQALNLRQSQKTALINAVTAIHRLLVAIKCHTALHLEKAFAKRMQKAFRLGRVDINTIEDLRNCINQFIGNCTPD